MEIRFSSKTVELTGKLQKFLTKKLLRLQKFSSLGIRSLSVIVDRVKRKSGSTSQASVELIAEIKGKRAAFKEIGENMYQAFYRVYEKAETVMRRTHRKKTSN